MAEQFVLLRRVRAWRRLEALDVLSEEVFSKAFRKAACPVMIERRDIAPQGTLKGRVAMGEIIADTNSTVNIPR